jgi:uncharacterized membrane protein
VFKNTVWNYHVSFCVRRVDHGHQPPPSGIQEEAMFGILGHSTETLVELLSGVTLLISWLFVQVVFALYYAHEFYGKNADSSNAVFPNNLLPDYWDFISFAFVIGLRIQAPRVQITSKKMRRVVIVQCLVSFILNLSIFMLATTIVVRRYW